jgi:beta-glucosidase
MKYFHFTRIAICTIILLAVINGFTQSQPGTDFKTVTNTKGPTLGYSTSSGVTILTIKGLHFKDLNKNGKLDPYEDWRLPVDTRAKDLAGKMTVEQIAGLMLYSAHQAIPANPRGFGAGTYNGKPIDSSGMQPYDISDQQKKFLKDDNLRHVLITRVMSPEVAAKWNNNVQAFVEGIGFGIPANNSSDPRNGVVANAEYNIGSGGTISMWPESIGMAATFDPSLVLSFGHIAAQEYRALGIATALSPQIDLATEPRWSRFNGTFGEDPQLAEDMARAYVDGFQTSTGSSEIKNGWGYHSVNAMVKHWPSGGPEEGGRDAHFAYGKFAVYPGNNFQTQLTPFVDGAFKLNGKTKHAAAVMPYYTISHNQDSKYGEMLATVIANTSLLTFFETNMDMMVWFVPTGPLQQTKGKTPDIFAGKSWGVEKLSVSERHYKVLMAGVDQFGGNNVQSLFWTRTKWE